MSDRTELGAALEEELREALAWKRSEIALQTRNIDPMPAERIPTRVAKSAKEL